MTHDICDHDVRAPDGDEPDADDLWRQIERCRRIASLTTDDQLRHTLDELAREYEARLPRRRDSFMLGSASPKV